MNVRPSRIWRIMTADSDGPHTLRRVLFQAPGTAGRASALDTFHSGCASRTSDGARRASRTGVADNRHQLALQGPMVPFGAPTQSLGYVVRHVLD